MRYVLRSAQAFNELNATQARSRALLSAIPDMIFRLDGAGRYLDFQPGQGVETMLPALEFIGKTMHQVLPEELADLASQHLKRVISSGVGQRFEYDIVTNDVPSYFEARMVASGENEVLTIVRDITDRKLREQQIHQLAFYDALTGLPNRQLFYEHLQQEIRHSDRDKAAMAVLFLDLDRFKLINDTLGHSVGDAVLAEVGRRLQQCVRSADLVSRPAHDKALTSVARLGGDEFTVLIGSIDDGRESELVARRMIEALSEPIIADGRELFVTPSIGIATYPVDGADAETLIRNADAAMYKAKDEGRNCIQFYSTAINDRALAKFTMETDLRKAIDQDALQVYYQPQVDLGSMRVVGMEALVRWEHPRLGFVPPVEFIPVAEEAGLIGRLGEFVMRTACRQAKAWSTRGAGEVRIAVNLSGRQFYDGSLTKAVAETLAETGLEAHRLELELTESMVMKDPKITVASLHELKEMGVTISVDDFGTGYSSLAYLKRYPLDTLKIDRSFVRDIATDPDDAAITNAIIAMAKSLGLRVVGEGVETIQQLEFLIDKGCDVAQGYLLGEPAPAATAEAMLGESFALEYRKNKQLV
jgi:diguanylate cyclase (GGDEF)-like protein/PAS domain S-box-containing protein